MAGATGRAFPAWNDRRDNDVPANAIGSSITGRYHAPGDFMTQCQWEGSTRWNAVVSEADIGMTDATSGNLDHNFIWGGLK